MAPQTAPAPTAQRAASQGEAQLLDNWLAIQAVNIARHAAALRPFRTDEFGTSAAAPSEAHIEAVNRFVAGLRERLTERARWVEAAASAARRAPSEAGLTRLLERKQAIGADVLFVEGIWDFYYDLFIQRLSSFGERLRAVDRIGANCYEDLYIGLGSARPTPRLLPFSYANSGFSPLTYRRGVPLRRLGQHPNLFPLIMLPQHRLDNVWALSSVLHEVAHNLQADLGLWDVMPVRIVRRLVAGGVAQPAAGVWARWHKEMMADMFALLLGGPAAVESLMDVVGRGPAATLQFSAHSVHPTPYLRVLISLELLRRMGFAQLAGQFERVWRRLYPRVGPDQIPPAFLRSFDAACGLAVDEMVFTPLKQLDGRSLAQLVEFGPRQLTLIELAAERLATGQDPGSIPPRFMIGAARMALDRRLAAPQTITDTFYRTLGRR